MTDVDSALRKRYPKLQELNRLIYWFDKETEDVVAGVYVENLPLAVLQKLYDCADDPMVDPFDITEKESEVLSHYTAVTFDFEKYDYELSTNYDYKRAGPWEGGVPFPVPSGE